MQTRISVECPSQ